MNENYLYNCANTNVPEKTGWKIIEYVYYCIGFRTNLPIAVVGWRLCPPIHPTSPYSLYKYDIKCMNRLQNKCSAMHCIKWWDLHSFIPAISILCRGFTLKYHSQLRVKDLPKVPTWRLEQDSNPRPFGQMVMNLPMSHHAHTIHLRLMGSVGNLVLLKCQKSFIQPQYATVFA